MIRSFILIVGALIIGCSGSAYKMQIENALRGMESAWEANDKLGVAQFYTDDGYLLSGESIAAQGRKAINSYWGDFRGEPVSWELKTVAIDRDFSTITQHENWQKIGEEIPLWDDFDISLPPDCIFHLGQSDLTFTRDNGEAYTSTVDFLLVWQKIDGEYKIFLDSYN